jgi:hypothetical protein
MMKLPWWLVRILRVMREVIASSSVLVYSEIPAAYRCELSRILETEPLWLRAINGNHFLVKRIPHTNKDVNCILYGSKVPVVLRRGVFLEYR